MKRRALSQPAQSFRRSLFLRQKEAQGTRLWNRSKSYAYRTIIWRTWRPSPPVLLQQVRNIPSGATLALSLRVALIKAISSGKRAQETILFGGDASSRHTTRRLHIAHTHTPSTSPASRRSRTRRDRCRGCANAAATLSEARRWIARWKSLGRPTPRYTQLAGDGQWTLRCQGFRSVLPLYIHNFVARSVL